MHAKHLTSDGAACVFNEWLSVRRSRAGPKANKHKNARRCDQQVKLVKCCLSLSRAASPRFDHFQKHQTKKPAKFVLKNCDEVPVSLFDNPFVGVREFS